MTRVVIEVAETVEPASLSEQVEEALRLADNRRVTYKPDSFDLTRFETDVENPLLATVEGAADVRFCETITSRARILGETRRESGRVDSDETEPAEIYLTIREFQQNDVQETQDD